MRPPIDWLAVTLLIGLIGPPRIAANAADSLRVTGSREPETQPSAIAQQSPIDIRGDDLQVVKKQAVPPLLVIPLVENAFKHGVSETRLRPFIDIHLSVKGKQFFLQVNNQWQILMFHAMLPA